MAASERCERQSETCRANADNYTQVIKLLPETIPLFVPDIPGYGSSTPSQTLHDKATAGTAILSSLRDLCSSNNGNSKARPHIVLVGHDRGARICHRLAVDAQQHSDAFTIMGTILMDIVPTTVQWQGMANPAEAAGCFHWPLLANVEPATSLIMQVGGDLFIRRLFDRWRGSASARGLENLTSDGAMEVYENSFKQESVVRAACLDYEAGATVDVEAQKKDQDTGQKLDIPTLVLHSAGLGKRFDMSRTWTEWVAGGDNKGLLEVVEIGDGAGHMFPEENPEETVRAMLEWMEMRK